MKQQKLFHLVLSAMLIVCTTGCYDKDEIKDAEKYLPTKIIQKSEILSKSRKYD